MPPPTATRVPEHSPRRANRQIERGIGLALPALKDRGLALLSGIAAEISKEPAALQVLASRFSATAVREAAPSARARSALRGAR